MDMESGGFETYVKLKMLCKNIDDNPKNSYNAILELKGLISNFPQHILEKIKPIIISSLYHFIKPADKLSFKEDHKILVVDTLSVLFEKVKVDKIGLFFNIYAFLLNEIYDPDQSRLVRNCCEEYKLSIMNCVKALTSSLSWDILMNVYSKENAPRFSPILYVALEIAKTEQLRTLRITAIECIMSVAKVLNEEDIEDTEICNQIADIFMFFLPGLSSGLRSVALSDEKIGHKIPQVAIRAWGRIVNILMRDYKAPDEKINVVELMRELDQMHKSDKTIETQQNKRLNDTEIKDYIQKSKRTDNWYRETDKKLHEIVITMVHLTRHSHSKVRSELADICVLLLKNCSNTMPKSISKIVEILIILSADEYKEISTKCLSNLSDLSEKFSSDSFKNLLDNLEEIFYSNVNSMPRIFNGIDDEEQLASLNLLIGYIQLFGKYKLVELLHSPTHLQRLIFTLIHISELERTEVCLLDEYTIQDLELNQDLRTPWKRFRYFNSDSIKRKLEIVCGLLSQSNVVDIVCDFLLDIYVNDNEHRKEATLILNEILSDSNNDSDKDHIIKSVICMYLEPTYWNLPITVMTDEFGNKYTLSHVQNNIIQICLQVEGIGKIALHLGTKFQEFLLKTLYAILERAGSGQPLLKAAGLSAISNISVACGYSSVTELINKNSDYFSFHVVKKLRHSEHNENVLNVLAVVMKHSTIEVLPSLSDIIDDVLMQSCDKYQDKNASAFLRVFNIFIKCLIRWLGIKVEVPPLKSKSQKKEELLNFKVSNIEENENFSDDIMGKTAEEMYQEDMQKKEEELDDSEPEIEEYKKPEPPMHIKLTVSILRRSLNFLPSKKKERKLLVLEILRNGLEVIREWENELLPIVHLIWSPLVDRFKESNEPLIINLSFQLLVTLARLSKDFIRSRTAKDVLPTILEIIRKLSSESFLKDKGAAYRYTQSYKLQNVLLQDLGRVVADLDMSDEHIRLTVEAVTPYLSDKQPLPLQESCVEFFKTLGIYDYESIKTIVLNIQNETSTKPDYNRNIVILVNHFESPTTTK